MEAITGRVDPERAWAGAAVAAVAALVAGSVAFPRQVYDRFLWQYFWGPVYADAHNARCAVLEGAPRVSFDTGVCRGAIEQGRVVAEPGYTPVSEVGYAITLVFMLVGVLFLIRRLGVGDDRRLFFALVPFMLFGGALRVVEDANDAVPPDATPFLSYPANSLIISPVIYFTVFVVTLAALVGSIALVRRGVASRYEYPLAGVGAAAFLLTVAVLGYLSVTTGYVGLYPQIVAIVVGGATAIAGIVWIAVERYAPRINRGTGTIGIVVLWGHAIDGVANVVAADWALALGLPFSYSAKHPVNRAIIAITEGILPPSLGQAIGTSWPFLLVKIVAALVVVWVFDEAIFEDSPRYAILLLIAILAVGLGPGTRDMLRATFGI